MSEAAQCLRLSPLGHTWVIDLDGTVLRHNGYMDGRDQLLPGVADFWAAIPPDDYILLLTARTEDHRAATLGFLRAHGLRFNQALFGLPVGERVLINDAKPSGMITALAVNVVRDRGLTGLSLEISAAV
jgi:hypothetical protein